MSTAIIKGSVGYYQGEDSFANISILQRKILEGKAFLGFVKYTISAGATKYIQIKTNSNGVCFCVATIETDGEKITSKILKSPTVTDGTTSINLINLNDESSNTTGVTAYSNPTGVSGGTQVDEFYVGGTFGQK